MRFSLFTILTGLAAMLLIYWTFGCAPMQFAKDGASEKDLAHASYDCDREWDTSAKGIATAQDPLGSLGYLAMVRGDKEACMARKGWTRRD